MINGQLMVSKMTLQLDFHRFTKRRLFCYNYLCSRLSSIKYICKISFLTKNNNIFQKRLILGLQNSNISNTNRIIIGLKKFSICTCLNFQSMTMMERINSTIFRITIFTKIQRFLSFSILMCHNIIF